MKENLREGREDMPDPILLGQHEILIVWTTAKNQLVWVPVQVANVTRASSVYQDMNLWSFHMDVVVYEY